MEQYRWKDVSPQAVFMVVTVWLGKSTTIEEETEGLRDRSSKRTKPN